MNKNVNIPFLLITVSIFIGLIVPGLIQDGMFMDGLIYASLAKNMANGIGSFWFPQFSKLGLGKFISFHAYPPLVFGLQSIFFKLLGNSMYVERLYSFLTACISAYLIFLIWKFSTKKNKKIQSLFWLPIFLWIIIPVNFWSYQNNMLENTMGVFILSSVYFSLKALDSYKGRYIYIKLLVSAFFIFLATFSKGVPGFFPVSIIFIYWIIYKDFSFSKMLIYTFILIIFPVIVYLLLLLNKEAYKSMLNLFYCMTVRINNPKVENSFYIINQLFMELLPVFIIMLIFFILFKIKSIKLKFLKSYRKKIIFFILIGASGSLPFLFTKIQAGYYLTPSFAFYTIAVALIIAPGLCELIKNIKTEKVFFKIFKGFAFASLVVVIIFSFVNAGKIGRDKEMLHDIYLVGKIIDKGSIISIDKPMWNEWNLQGYLIRYFNISVDNSNNCHKFYLHEKSLNKRCLNKYKKIPLATKRYDLYVNKDYANFQK